MRNKILPIPIAKDVVLQEFTRVFPNKNKFNFKLLSNSVTALLSRIATSLYDLQSGNYDELRTTSSGASVGKKRQVKSHGFNALHYDLELLQAEVRHTSYKVRRTSPQHLIFSLPDLKKGLQGQKEAKTVKNRQGTKETRTRVKKQPKIKAGSARHSKE
ncbi:hypothetical protein Tco_0595808 [Tanacetum coccineum]